MGKPEPLPGGIDEVRHHGGNINVARRLFPNAPEPWIDLSTGINPVSYPIGTIAPSAWTGLPQAADIQALEETARTAYGARGTSAIVAAPGTQALIQWLPRLVTARTVGILGVTYGEHERTWRASGAEVARVERLEDLAAFDVGVLVNPNNPDGRIAPVAGLLETASALAAHGGLLVVDEAFADVLDAEASLVPELPAAGALVLRSFGKIFGLAGVRLGFAVSPHPLGRALRAAIGPWPISGPAIEIGRRALADRAWLTDSLKRLSNDGARLDTLLRAAGFELVGATKLFRLARHEDAAGWFDRLGHAGILVRPFDQEPHWLRFGIPGEPAAWARLEARLRPADLVPIEPRSVP